MILCLYVLKYVELEQAKKMWFKIQWVLNHMFFACSEHPSSLEIPQFSGGFLDKTSAKGPAFDQPCRRGQENGEKLPEFSSTKCGWDTVWDVEPTKNVDVSWNFTHST